MCSKKLLQPRSKRLLPAFSSWRILMDYWLTFRSFIHFEFNFVYAVRKMIQFYSSACTVQFFQHDLMKRLPFSLGYSFLLCPRLVGQRAEGPFLGSLFCSTDLCVYFCASTMLSWWLHFCNRSWSPRLWCHLLWFSFFNIPLAIRGLFWFHTNFRIICSSSVKNVVCILIEITLTL